MALDSKLSAEASVLHHLPLVRAVIDQLEIPQIIEELSPKDPRSRVSDADCVVVAILNVLAGRSALYRMGDWLRHVDLPLLLGPQAEADAFGDDRLAATLDRLFAVGTDTVMSKVATRYLERPGRRTSYLIHQDTTTLKLEGAFENTDEDDAPKPARGHSKDHRPDLKQLVFGLSLHGAAGIPLVGSVLDGNTGDATANRLHLDKLAKLLPKEDEATLVADCKAVDGVTVARILDQGLHFVSLLPDTFSLRRTLIGGLKDRTEPLPTLVREPGRTRKDPPKEYRGASYDAQFPIWKEATDDADVVGAGGPKKENKKHIPLRFLVVKSSQLEEKFERTLEARLTRETEAFRSALTKRKGKTKETPREVFSCRGDAEKARDRLLRKLSLQTADVSIEEEQVRTKRARPGRPRAGEVPEFHTEFHLELRSIARNEAAIQELRETSVHFVLVTDHLDRQKWSDERILATYRAQHLIEGHTGFRWLKNTASVAPVLLHTPRRIAALGLVFLLTLMVRNYIQFILRDGLAREGIQIDGRNHQPTSRPTTETAFLLFEGLTVIRILMDGVLVQRRPPPLHPDAIVVLRLLGVSPEVFWTPLRKSRGGGGGMGEM